MPDRNQKNTPASPKALLIARGIHPKKRLGQNFLCDPQAADMIVRRAGLDPEGTVIEIGPGTGALTLPAARRVNQLCAIEKDPQLIGLLEEIGRAAGLENITVRHQDILETDLMSLADDLSRKTGKPPVVMGNLPYNISSQVIIKLIRARERLSKAVLMLQKELAQRLIAPPGSKDYGRPTVMLRYCADVATLAQVKPGLFFPRPRVASEVIVISFQNKFSLSPAEETILFDIIKAAFGQRRKTIKNALLNQDVGLDTAACGDALEKSGIDPLRRAETLDAADYVEICKYYVAIQNQ